MRGVKLFQGYLWHPKALEFDPKQALPARLGEGLEDGPVHLLIDPVRPPFAFFQDGTPNAQRLRPDARRGMGLGPRAPRFVEGPGSGV
ncbi:hypothetical protein Mterra_03718 [Calidithermus terrae]|uniref:Uncharacterized protein n=1 Tax=Calidithermus terrae TaxID=1408545 RepID=A0A399E6L9_9DEIN|nr:DUF3208 family protein [Calidithermus terrae]RIH77921.1 hypothetical protein Mterra_03718 [Calidithermus terrae]